jgi:hypothetical protein
VLAAKDLTLIEDMFSNGEFSDYGNFVNPDFDAEENHRLTDVWEHSQSYCWYVTEQDYGAAGYTRNN